MGKNPFQYALTRDQSIALVLVEPLGCTELVKYIIRVIKDEQMKDSRNEHLELRDICHFDPSLPMNCLVPISTSQWEIQKKVFINIQCLRQGFLKVLVVSEENEGWRNHNHRRATYARPYNMDIIPGMEEMSFQGKLKMLNVYLLSNFDIVKGSLACFNIGLRGSTEEDDYGGVYYEAFSRVQPEIEIMRVVNDIHIVKRKIYIL